MKFLISNDIVMVDELAMDDQITADSTPVENLKQCGEKFNIKPVISFGFR